MAVFTCKPNTQSSNSGRAYGKTIALLAVAAAAIACPALTADNAPSDRSEQRIDIDFAEVLRHGHIAAGEGARLSATEDHLRLEATRSGREARADAFATPNLWNFSEHGALNFQLHNPGARPIVVYARAANPDPEQLMDNTRNAILLMPEETKTLKLRLNRRPEDPGYEPFRQFMMYYRNINVRDNTIDPSRIESVSLWIEAPEQDDAVHLLEVWPSGEGTGTPEFFPFVDQYGQYRHSDWPGKIHGDDGFAAQIEEERQEMADWPGPGSWNQYGGWNEGPQLEATGFFRTEKVNGKWWLVDPEGRLFWSHGPTGVGYGGDFTPINDREYWFAHLPDRDGPAGQFYGEGRGATYMYYENREWTGFDFGTYNIHRKFGEDAERKAAGLLHDRMRSWGFNTMANWSSPDVYLLRRTPYTVAIHAGGPSMHYRMRDIYHPDWRRNLRRAMERERETTAGDPWNLGYFVDNELWWGWRPRAASVGLTAIEAPAETYSKQEFLNLLREKYDSIEALNEAWEAEYASWNALLESRRTPNTEVPQVIEDCGDFGMQFAEYYFSTVREEVKRVAPDNMYLGVRFHGHIDPAVVELCGRYADVVSYNIYDNPPQGRLNQYLHLDLPIISGEWGIRSNPLQTPFRGDDPISPNPRERADSFARYLEAGFRHPLLVGAHFFQFRDQPISGRPDGEAIPRGLVNITDTPHFDLISTNRRLAYDLYERRYNSE